MKEVHKAILAVMDEVKGIDKSMTIGTGMNSYKGVSDKDVKQIIGKSLFKNGLTIIPIKIVPTIRVDRWEEVDPYSKSVPKDLKSKQQIFTEVLCTYLITHAVSGESVEIMGYGHGVDTQDKSAGKATTYALKNALLYVFQVPTGKLEDSDNTHSDSIQIVPAIPQPKVKQIVTDSQFEKAVVKYETDKDYFTKLGEAMTFTAQQQLEINEILGL